VSAPSYRFAVATANTHKASEIAAVLGEACGGRIELVPRPAGLGEVEETGETLEENARLKALAVCTASGMPAIADDTGLEVVALGGAPGVFSSRFAGEGATYATNVRKLLASLEGATDRRARFRTVAMIVWPGREELAAEGVLDGLISEEARGEGGFGYDPVFVPDEGDGRTFAEMGATEKNSISPRGRAFRSLASLLENRDAHDAAERA
jgi:XTP/dITP diphosphohydrolase